jgi:hypothetical protein
MRPFSYSVCGILTAVCVFLSGCSKKTTETEPSPEPAEPAATTPQPKPVVAVATPTPTPKRLAPAGTFFLLVKKSVMTGDGVLGFKPGTTIKQEADGSYTVEGHKLEIRASEITNDLDIAASYASADAQRQAVIRQVAATPVPAPATSASSLSNQSHPSSSPSPSAPRPAASSSAVVAPVRPTGSGLETSSSLGASHTMTKDGWIWQKDGTGDWRRVKPLR